jgi:hypothetical protein
VREIIAALRPPPDDADDDEEPPPGPLPKDEEAPPDDDRPPPTPPPSLSPKQAAQLDRFDSSVKELAGLAAKSSHDFLATAMPAHTLQNAAALLTQIAREKSQVAGAPIAPTETDDLKAQLAAAREEVKQHKAEADRLNETIEVVTLNASGEVVDIGVTSRAKLCECARPPVPRDPKMLNVVLDGMYKQIDKIVGTDDLGRKLNELKGILPEIAADLSGHDQPASPPSLRR